MSERVTTIRLDESQHGLALEAVYTRLVEAERNVRQACASVGDPDARGRTAYRCRRLRELLGLLQADDLRDAGDSFPNAVADALVDQGGEACRAAGDWLRANRGDAEVEELLASFLDRAEQLATARLTAQEALVTVITIDGDGYDRVLAEASTDPARDPDEATVEILARWDTGDEVDLASTVLGTTSRREVESRDHAIVEHGGLTYWLEANHGLRYYALYRPKLLDSEI